MSIKKSIVAVLAMLAPCAVIVPAQVHVAHAAPVGALWLEGEVGDYIVGPQHVAVTPLNVSATPNLISFFFQEAANPLNNWQGFIAPPQGQTFHVGAFTSVRTATPTTAGLDVFGQSRGCNISTGRFVIDEISFDGAGALVSLAIRWEQHCEGGEAASFGALVVNPTVAHAERSITRSIAFASTAVGSSIDSPVVIANAGPSPLHVASATITGLDAGSFSVSSDPCSGTTIPSGGSCTVQVRFAPLYPVALAAKLTVVDDIADAGGTGEDTELAGAATTPHQLVALDGEIGDFPVQPQHLILDSVSVAGGAFGIDISAHNATSSYHISVAGPTGTSLAPGVYTNAARFASVSQPGFSLYGDGRGCNVVSARFIIDELTITPSGQVGKLAARWEQHCEGGDPASFGSVEYNSVTRYPDRSFVPRRLDFPDAAVTPIALESVVVTSSGSVALHVASVGLTGADSGQFLIVLDSCSGVTVAPGGTCTVTVTYLPTTPSASAKLTFFDDIAPIGGTGEDVVLTGVDTGGGPPVGGGTGPTVFNLYVQGADDDGLIGPQHLTSTTSTVTGDVNGITISGSTGLDDFTIDLAPPTGSAFVSGTVGTFPTAPAGRQPFGTWGMTLTVDGLNCPGSAGLVAIDQMTFDGTGTLTALVARWQFGCIPIANANGGGTLLPYSYGGVDANGTVPYREVTVDAAVTWNQVQIGTSVGSSMQISNAGPSALAIGAVSITGPDAAAFSLAPSPCANISLGANGSCYATLVFHPTDPTPREYSATVLLAHQGSLSDVGGTPETIALHASSTVPPFSHYGEFTAITPARIMSTVTGIGTPRGPLHNSSVPNLKVTGVGGVPASGVSAVVLNVTAANVRGPGYISVFPYGTFGYAAASNLNLNAGQVVANMVTVPVGVDGRINIFNHSVSVDVIVDIVGFYSADTGPAGARFHAMAPARMIDTRSGVGGVIPSPIGRKGTLRYDVLGRAGLPFAGVSAVVLNVTAVKPTAGGFLTVYPDGVPLPPTSSLNFRPGDVVPNLVTVKVPPSGYIDIYNNSGSTNVVVDVVGYYGAATGNAGRFVALTPFRAVDTRTEPTGPLGPDSLALVLLGGYHNIPHDAAAAMLNVTAVAPTASGYLQVYPDDLCGVPTHSNVNFVAGQTVPNAVVTSLSGTSGPCAFFPFPGLIDIYNLRGDTHVLVDVFGFFT